MKYMKLGSKPDQFQTDGDNVRYVATELATDMVIAVGDVKFYLHKFPLLSKCARLQKLVANATEENNDEININDIPGGPMAFEICAKFCYGMIVILNAYDVIAARCAAEYLEMYESVEKGNLVYKIEVFLNSSILRSWKDSIIALQTTKSIQFWSEELKLVNQCLESIASKVVTDTSKIDWSYTYSRESGNDMRRFQKVPEDWWVEDLCDLQIDIYNMVINTILTKGVSPNLIGKSLKAYTYKKLPGFSSGLIQGGDYIKYQYIVDTIICLLPKEKYSVSCSFLLKLLRASIFLECEESGRKKLIEKIGQQLEEATVLDLQIHGQEGVTAIYNIELVHDLVEHFIKQVQGNSTDGGGDNDFIEPCCPKVVISDKAKMKVAHLVDVYLADAARDHSLPMAKFIELAEMVAGFPRPSHDGIYRAIDMYMKEHTEITKSEKKRICRLMDVRKLSVDACSHAVQNERLPLRVVVQVLFFEQVRSSSTVVAVTASSSGGQSPSDISGSIGTTVVPGGSYGSSRSITTNTEDDEWDGHDHKTLKGELAMLRVKDGHDHGNGGGGDRKMKGLVTSTKIFSRLWSNKERCGENSSSETSESPSPTPSSSNAEETKYRS